MIPFSRSPRFQGPKEFPDGSIVCMNHHRFMHSIRDEGRIWTCGHGCVASIDIGGELVFRAQGERRKGTEGI